MKSPSFQKRFNIEINLEEMHRRFLNRINNQIFDDLFLHDVPEKVTRGRVLWQIAHVLGESYDWDNWFDYYIENDYYKCLQALEAAYSALQNAKYRSELEDAIKYVIESSEIDIGIQWHKGCFLPSGSKLLDNSLVNENLNWLSEQKYQNVYKPFEKALRHFVEIGKRPELGFDVITDMYEALEAFVKIITGRETKDLSSNIELYLKKIDLSDSFKPLLKSYIQFANEFRHGTTAPNGRQPLPKQEIESFIYLTGLFIRLGKEAAA